jgi:nicotinamidase-related amidase
MAIKKELPIPAHFDPSKAASIYRTPYLERLGQAKQWASEHGIPLAHEDSPSICLMLIDCQNTFCLPDFELFVAGPSGNGAVEDSARICEFIYKNLASITSITATMDSHRAAQIFHPLYWIDENGNHPEPMTIVKPDDINKGRWRVNKKISGAAGFERVESMDAYARHYVEELSRKDRYDLIIWPFHGMIGGIGHALVSSIEDAIFFHDVCRYTQTIFEIKGDNPITEHYSALSPEVTTDREGSKVGEKNSALINRILDFDHLIIAGQAKSHCLAWTVEDLLGEIGRDRQDLIKKVYLLEDCSSPVVVPGVADFTEQADKAFKRFQDAGMNIVKSTEPITSWPGLV